MFQTLEITSWIALQGINNMKSDSKGSLENTRQQEAAHFKERGASKKQSWTYVGGSEELNAGR